MLTERSCGRRSSGEGSAAGLAAAQRRRLTGARGEGAADPFRAPGLHESSIGGPAWEPRWSQRRGGRRR